MIHVRSDMKKHDQGEQMSREDQIDEWMIKDGLKKERRSKIVTASAERLVSEDPGQGEAAMMAIASWMETQPDLPLVESAVMSTRTILLEFAEDTVLPEPWRSETGNPHDPHDTWALTHEHALTLPSGDGYGWQIVGLTSWGNILDGSRLFLSTTRWEILNISGTAEWTRDLMLCQVMTQAAEPWSSGHDIWICGYEEEDKLASFVAHAHPVHRFHKVNSLDEIDPEQLTSPSTIYVRSGGEQAKAFAQRIQGTGVGMVVDQIISESHLNLTEEEEGAAVLLPFDPVLRIYPNISQEYLTEMEQAWDSDEVYAEEQAAAADFAQLLNTPETANPAESQEENSEKIRAEFESLIAGAEISSDVAAEETPSVESSADLGGDTEEEDAPAPTLEAPSVDETEDQHHDSAEEVHQGKTPEQEPVEPSGTGLSSTDPASAKEAPTGPEEQEGTSETETQDFTDSEPQQEHTPQGEDHEEPPVDPEQSVEAPEGLHLSLLGDVRAHTPVGELTGRHAAALAILEMTNEPVTPQQISEFLWPEDESGGHTARTRRSRLRSRLHSYIGDVINTDEGWSLEAGHFSTDYDQVLSSLTTEPLDNDEAIVAACGRIEAPLEGAGQWADYYGPQMTSTLIEALKDLRARAVEEDAFDVEKAAKTAIKKLEG